MKTKLIPLISMTLSGLIALLICLLYNRTLLDMLIIVLIVMLIFFVIGYIAEQIFNSFLVVNEPEDETTDGEDGEEGEVEDMENVENFNIDMDEENEDE